jgi:hypothetical integral membrane protein (TIGR02206 family)
MLARPVGAGQARPRYAPEVGPFDTFSSAHVAILAAVTVAGIALGAWGRRVPAATGPVRLALAAWIAGNELVFYGWVAARGWIDPPHGLPLDLCDVVLWATVYALVTLRPAALDAIYYLALAGTGMALLTPDPGAALPSYPAVKFFLAHGSVVVAVLFLVGAGLLRPRPGSWWRVLLWTNAYALGLLAFNLRFGTNYMFLREKPGSGSLLDFLGPWPWYLAGGEVIAVALFALLHVPFRASRRRDALR